MRARLSPPWNLHCMLRCLLAIVVAFAFSACDEVNVNFPPDAEPDSTDDPIEDLPAEEAEPPCTYPDGPHAFTAVGDIAPPMSWPSAMARPDDLGSPASLADLHCDPDVHSIFIQYVTIACIYCPERMMQIAYLRDHWETHGAKWIFIVGDASDAVEANSYTEDQGVSFGWSTNDEDNSEGANYFRTSPIHDSSVPWTGVIRASDMQITHDEASGTSLDIEAIAVELDPS